MPYQQRLLVPMIEAAEVVEAMIEVSKVPSSRFRYVFSLFLFLFNIP